MSTDPILSIDRCFEEMHPSATEDVQCLAVKPLVAPELKMFPLEHQVVKLHKRIAHCKKAIPKALLSFIQIHKRMVFQRKIIQSGEVSSLPNC